MRFVEYLEKQLGKFTVWNQNKRKLKWFKTNFYPNVLYIFCICWVFPPSSYIGHRLSWSDNVETIHNKIWDLSPPILPPHLYDRIKTIVLVKYNFIEFYIYLCEIQCSFTKGICFWMQTYFLSNLSRRSKIETPNE